VNARCVCVWAVQQTSLLPGAVAMPTPHGLLRERPAASSSSDERALLFFSTRQGRQSNCVLTVEMARFVAERLNRQLVLPNCHTSPLGEQACSHRPDIPPQRQTVVSFSLPKALRAADLARCWRPPASAPTLLSPLDIPLSAAPRNVTCVEIVAGRHHRERGSKAPSPCELELSGDDELRTQLPIRITATVTLPAAALQPEHRELPAGSPSGVAVEQLAALPKGDLFLHSAFGLFAHGAFTKQFFQLCSLPRESEGVARMERHLQRSLGMPHRSTMCVHWRAEDFHHPTTLKRHHQNGTAAAIATQVVPRARGLHASAVMILSNARHEELSELLARLRAAGLHAQSPRLLGGTSFDCRASYVYGAFAEMLACSRARHFVGSPRSSFSGHILAMREARGGAAANGTVAWLLDRV
jgi:hypothetical protein